MQNIIVKDRQSILDIALQTVGSIEAVFDLAIKNDLSITDILETDSTLISSRVLDRETVEYYTINNISPATSYTGTSLAPLQGIDYWAVAIDFIISN